ncbi:GNAT family N-acetyltransferase [Nioella aestuarii]|uniref:GNAT family N-acetyltransferase n=1 Tax=Nioella aestuarii TaxID=1662864 RepID=UPI003D7FE8DC
MIRAPHEIPATGPAATFAAQLQAALPMLDTDRLILRAPRIEDFEIYAAIGESERGRYLVDDNTDRDALWLDFAQMVACWLLRGHGVWTVETRDTGKTIGFVLLGFEPGDHEPELGYLFLPEAECHGYAQEAARAARAYAFDTLGLKTLVSTIDHDNARSIRLTERLGAARDSAAEAAHNHAIQVYRHSAEETLQ